MNATTTPALYIVATPLGNLQDITLRALEILKNVDLIAAEDTRHSRVLLQHYGITTSLIALHEHNERAQSETLLVRIEKGESIALISDAGTPLISDPGYHLVCMAREKNIKVIPIPGPSAIIAALSVAGLPTDHFTFAGFLSAKDATRQKQLDALKDVAHTLIFYEAPHRILTTIKIMLKVFGHARQAVIARELTKTFETIHADSLENLSLWLENDANQQRGEMVILVQGAEPQIDEMMTEAIRITQILLRELPLKQAVKLAAEISGAKKNLLYEQALQLEKSSRQNP